MATLIEASIGSEWLLTMGRRPAYARVAHLICELTCRLDAVGQLVGEAYEFPLTQEQMGDALGLTAVHVNRMLRQLVEDGLIVREGRRMIFPDRSRLERAADFSDDYLHIGRPCRTD
jgi:CRP-like cAMP-binding protein